MSQTELTNVRRFNRRAWSGLVGLFLALHVTLVLEDILTWAPLMDEPAHLAAGVVYALTGEFDLYNVNPPLARLIGAVPALLVMDASLLPSRSDEYKDLRLEGRIGHDFFVKNTHSLWCLRGARLCSLIASVAVAWMILCWATRISGRVGGLCALGLWCFSPTVISSAATFGADMPATAAILATVMAYERALKTPAWFNTLAAGTLLGIAFLTKFTALALTPMLAGCLAIRPGLGSRHWWALAAHGAVVFGWAVIVCNLGYGLRGIGTSLETFTFQSRPLTGHSVAVQSGNRFRGSFFGALPSPFPEVFVKGVDTQLSDFDRWGVTYFAGSWHDMPPAGIYWRVMFLKAPLGTLGLIAFSIFRLSSHLRMPRGGRAMSLNPCLWLSLFAIAGAVIHKPDIWFLRYLLPAFPLAAIVFARVCSLPKAMHRFGPGIITVCLLCNAVTSVEHHGEHLSYIGELFGGPYHAHEWLIDGNTDCGQDVLKLTSWAMIEGIADRLHVSVVSPLTYLDWGFRAAPASAFHTNFTNQDSADHPGPIAGIFAVSDTYLESRDGGLKYLTRIQPKRRFGSIAVFEITPAEATRLRSELGITESKFTQSEPTP